MYPGSGSIREITRGGFTVSHGGKNCTCKPVKDPVSRKGQRYQLLQCFFTQGYLQTLELNICRKKP